MLVKYKIRGCIEKTDNGGMAWLWRSEDVCFLSSPSTAAFTAAQRGEIASGTLEIMSQGRRAISQNSRAEGSRQEQLETYFGPNHGPGHEASKMAPTPTATKAAKSAQKALAQQQQQQQHDSQISSPRLVSDKAPPSSASHDQGSDMAVFLA